MVVLSEMLPEMQVQPPRWISGSSCEDSSVVYCYQVLAQRIRCIRRRHWGINPDSRTVRPDIITGSSIGLDIISKREKMTVWTNIIFSLHTIWREKIKLVIRWQRNGNGELRKTYKSKRRRASMACVLRFPFLNWEMNSDAKLQNFSIFQYKQHEKSININK